MKTQFYLIFGFLMILFIGCKNETSNEEAVKIENHGAEISYDDTAEGDTTLLFVHGWSINKGYWEEQIKNFKQKYRVVTIDLPGFGASGKNRDNWSWSVENYGSDISAVIKKLNLKNIIIVGHSMSGAIALEAALQNPDNIIALVGVDNFKNYGFVETPGSKAEYANVYKMMKDDYTKTITRYTNEMLLAPSTDSATRQRVLKDLTGADSVIAVKVMETGDQYPIDQKLKTYNKTLYLINSDLFPTDINGFRKDSIRYKLFNMGPTGHYPMVEKPQEFNKYLRMIIEDV
jgi:pimeloyl-ACP methyl ester carboxylesterase